MTILTGIASVAVSGIWKVGAIAALAGGLLAIATLGYQWHMAAHDRDVAQGAIVTERAANADLRTSIREQNRAVESMGKAKEAADARGAHARQLAAANGQRFDRALDGAKDARATTCDEAMPAVNAILGAIK